MDGNTEQRSETPPISSQGNQNQTQGSFGKEFDIESGDDEGDGDAGEDPDARDAEQTAVPAESPDGCVNDPWVPIPRLRDLLAKLFPPRR